MKLKAFMEMYCDWNRTVVINDDDLEQIAKGIAVNVMDERKDLWNMEVVCFGFYDNELCVRVR